MTLEELKRLSGIKVGTGVYPPDNVNHSETGSNISLTGMEKKRIEKENNIRPGTDEWFKLWFSLPYLTGEKYKPDHMPKGFRGRKK